MTCFEPKTYEEFESLINEHPLIIFFFTTASETNPERKAIASKFEGYTSSYYWQKFGKIDLEQHPEIAEAYKIYGTHNFVAFKNGRVNSYCNTTDASDLLCMLDRIR
ncbi:unnamed protein product [Cunninghamella echinulata]